jgi:hypothetical protein
MARYHRFQIWQTAALDCEHVAALLKEGDRVLGLLREPGSHVIQGDEME